jgi:hexosaminidase
MEGALRLLLVLMAIMPAACTGDVVVNYRPRSVSHGKQTVYITKDLKMTVVGSNYSDEKAILKDAFGRMVAVMEQDHAISESYTRSPVLVGVNVVVRSPDDEVY